MRIELVLWLVAGLAVLIGGGLCLAVARRVTGQGACCRGVRAG